MLDIAIKGGTALVGAECRPERADVGIADGRVVAIGTHVGAARVSLDARGGMVAPGFVDIHTHSDFTLPIRPQGEAKLRQGVTTDVTGNCGFSPFPTRRPTRRVRSAGSSSRSSASAGRAWRSSLPRAAMPRSASTWLR